MLASSQRTQRKELKISSLSAFMCQFRAFIVTLLIMSVVVFGQGEVFAATISATSTVTITANVIYPEDDPPPGGGSPPVILPPTEVVFSGFGYPFSLVTLLKDSQYLSETNAVADSDFSLMIDGLSGGTYSFSLYAQDDYGNQSSSVTYSVNVINNARTTISGIIIPPTVTTDLLEVKQGDSIVFYGQTKRDCDVIVEIDSTSSTTINTITNGLYEYSLNTTDLDLGEHFLRVKMVGTGIESPYSDIYTFVVGEETVVEEEPFLVGDVNYDDSVNIVDFSIAAYWYDRILNSAFVIIEQERLNGDGVVDLIDFSLMAYYWTG